MLPERLYQLLTAYVDGALTARQLRAVQRLLSRSVEARTVLRQLQEDAAQLQQLPRQTLPADFAPQVLLAIGARGLQPMRQRRTRAPAGVPAWLGLAAAAAVLLVISGASYLYFAVSSLEPGAGSHAAQPAPENRDADPTSRPAVAHAPLDRTTPAPRELLPPPRADQIAQAPGTASDPGPSKPDTGATENELESILAIPNPKMELFPQIADTRLALILSLAQLDKPQPRKELDDELAKDTGYRIELDCREGNRAVDRLRAAFRAQGVRLVIDQLAQQRLRLKLRTNYALYVENVTRAEVTRLLRRLAVDDQKMKGPRQFDKAVLQRMTPADHAEVSKLLGVDPKVLATPTTKSPRDVDLHQPLSKTTAEQVEKALTGQGGRPAPGRPVAKPGERLAVVVAYNPVRPRPASAQVKQFLDSRKERQPDTVQLVLVLRGGNG